MKLGPRVGSQIRGEFNIVRVVRTGYNKGFANVVEVAQPTLDFSQLDSDTVNLDLEIFAPEKLEDAVRSPAAQIPSAIGP
jgi:hypothetical protein